MPPKFVKPWHVMSYASTEMSWYGFRRGKHTICAALKLYSMVKIVDEHSGTRPALASVARLPRREVPRISERTQPHCLHRIGQEDEPSL